LRTGSRLQLPLDYETLLHKAGFIGMTLVGMLNGRTMLQAMRPAVRKALVILALIVLAPVAAWKLMYPTYTHRIRMTANVAVGNELRSGSSVIEVQWQRHPRIGDSGEFSPSVSGDAAFVDLGDGRNLLVTLKYGSVGQEGIFPIMVLRLFGVDLSKAGLRKLERERRELQVQADGPFRPTMMTFADLSDPNSARVVTPENMAETLGSDVRLKSVVMELTDDPVTRTLASHLPWLDAMRKREKARGVSTNSRGLNVNSLLLSRGL
jgi:hypothetical protein